MRKIILTIFLSADFLLLMGQKVADSIPEPEFINHVYVLDKNHKLQNLEKKDAEVVSKRGGLGGGKQLYEINGSKSTVILDPDSIMFVMGTSGGGFSMDPSVMISLYKFETKKNKREALSAAYGGMMNKSKAKDNPNEIALNFKKLRDGVFGIVPEKPLLKGEYAFVNMMSMQGGGISMKMDAFAFAIQ